MDIAEIEGVYNIEEVLSAESGLVVYFTTSTYACISDHHSDYYIQDATSTQSYNRYSYALNNPLKYTDPSGESLMDIYDFDDGKVTVTAMEGEDVFFDKDGNQLDKSELSADEKFTYEVLSNLLRDGTFAFDKSGNFQSNTFYDFTITENRGAEMRSASSYDYSQDVIPGKAAEDWNYIKNGSGGNYFTRAGNILSRDWNAASTGDRIDFVVNVGSVVLPFIRIGKLAAKGGTSLWPAASGGRTVINGIEYTTHALEIMQPIGTIMRGATSYSRGILPSVVENAVKYGKITPGNTAAEVVRTLDNVRVITNPAGTRVISVFKIGN